jgi:hypothetical protein
VLQYLGGKPGQRWGRGGVGGDPPRSPAENGMVEGAGLLADQQRAGESADKGDPRGCVKRHLD